MRRTLGLLCLALVTVSPAVFAQTPLEMRKTAAFIEATQNPDGGFGATKGAPSSLGATSSAVRMLKNVGGSVPDISACIEYLKSCRDAASGGFAPTPGGKPGVAITASGLMALGELKLADPEMVNAAIKYFSTEAKSFEEIRIAIAGLEAVKTPSPDFPRWAEQIQSDRNSDGTWGHEGAQARATGSAAAALLRMSLKLDKQDAVLAALRSGQRPDGGWSRDGKDSDLETTYRIMRCFFLMKEKPDLDAVRNYISRHRQEDGSYSSKLGATDGGGTYFATMINRWTRILSGEPAVVETAGFVPLFDGKSLEGWEGDTSLWSAKDGVLVGTSPGLNHNDFLATTKTYGDFILKVSFRLTGAGSPNSGIQFRSVRIAGGEMSGYQADIGDGFWGCLYDESRRNRVLVPASEAAKAAVRRDGWNEYILRVMGDHITLTLNGKTSVDYFEKDPAISRDGKIAFQIHAGGPLKVEYKDVYIQTLPIPTADDSAKTGFHLRTVKTDTGERKYAVYLPLHFDPEKTYPAVLFLHGSGERGDDGIRQVQAGLGPIIAKNPENFPVIAVFPQAKKTWAADSDDIKEALAAFEDVKKQYKVDEKKVYLTGLSMGGFGSWGLAAKHPTMFAAVAPVCGFGEPKWAESIKSLPVWTFLGDEDNSRIVGGTRDLVMGLKKAGGSPRWTEYRGVGHNSWDRAYSDPELLKWMLSQSR